MTDRPPWRVPPAILKYILYLAAIGAPLATVIQIVNADAPTPLGLAVGAGILMTGTIAFAYDRIQSRGIVVPDMTISQAADREVLGMVRQELAERNQELQDIRSALEVVFGTDPPYSDKVTMIFYVGDNSFKDRIVERHETSSGEESLVRWYAFSAFTRGRDNALYWQELDLVLSREPDVSHEAQSAEPIPLTINTAPRALITFTPPRSKVTWTVTYRSPGLWDQLRDEGQRVSWSPPPATHNGFGDGRSSVREVTFFCKTSQAFGPLIGSNQTAGVSFDSPTVDAEGLYVHKVVVDVPVALSGSPETPADEISWYWRRSSRGGTR